MKNYLRWEILLLCILLSLRQAQSKENIMPRGFALVGALARYGTPEQKLANGSIFDYMDGGGIVYLEHGFCELGHCEFSNAGSGSITFDRFTMAAAEQALAALADERIAPQGGAPLSLNTPNKAYRFPPDYFIYLVWDRHLIYLHVNDDQLAETLDQFAVDVLKSLKEEKE
jgi:hypothetical protein